MSTPPYTPSPANSTNRKRSYNEISRSESRSVSAAPSPKRRRLRRIPSSLPSPQSHPHIRTARDGFDYRRPVMSNTQQSQTIVDLTGDDDESDSISDILGLNDEADTFNPAHFGLSPSDDENDFTYQPREGTASGRRISQVAQRAPSSTIQPSNHAVIDLSDDENDVPDARPHPVRRSSSGSDIVFLSERAAPHSHIRHTSTRRRVPTPGPNVVRPTAAMVPPVPQMPRFADFVRTSTQFLGRFAQAFQAPAAHQHILDPAPDDDLEIVDLDYRQAAFAMDESEGEAPQATPGVAYKAPPKVPEGFAGDVNEDDIYLCPRCEEELATGPTEEKQQVWVAKQCGHVYCGGCARERQIKNGTKKEKREHRKHKNDEHAFRACVVDGCNSKVDTQGSMILVYL